MVCSLKTPNKGLVELLVQSGAELAVPGEKIVALEMATREGQADIVRYLVSAGAPVNAQNKDGVTSLMCACFKKRSEIVSFLLNQGADLDIQDKEGTAALHFACYKQMIAGVELLLAHGADHSLRGKGGSTPLMYACFKESNLAMDPSILILLLSAGAEPNAQNENDSTALITAAYGGYQEGITVLLNAGASVNIRDRFGLTALHVAAEYGFLSISELLLASGAQASLTDNDGMTPLDYALDNNHHDVCQLLLANMDSAPLPAVTETTDTTTTKIMSTKQESIPLHGGRQESQHSSAFSTLDQLRYALEYPLSPADTIKHHQADEEEEGDSNKPESK